MTEPTVLVGPSRFLPPPLDDLSRAAWDIGSFHGRRLSRAVPLSVAQSVAWSAERLQRPTLPTVEASDGELVVRYEGHDPLLRDKVGSLLAPSAEFRAASSGRAPDVSCREIPTFSARRVAATGALVLPHFIELEVDLDRPEMARFGARRRESVRRVERSGLTLMAATGEASTREFYETMFVPTALARHGAHAIVRRKRYVEAAIRRGSLLLVRSGEESLAGLVVVPRFADDGAEDAWLFGVKNGTYDDSTVAREAAYLFAMRSAKDERGVRRFGLTTAPPFSSDGLVRYKQSWGASTRPGLRVATALAIRVERPSRALLLRLASMHALCVDFSREQPSLHTLTDVDLGSDAEDLGKRVAELAARLAGP